MPLASVDYDYYEYVNGQRTNRASYVVGNTAVKRTTSTTATRRPTTTVPQRTTTARRTTTTAKKPATTTVRKTTTARKTATTTTTTTKKPTTAKTYKHNIDIPLSTKSTIKNKPKEMELKKPKTSKATLTIKETFVRVLYVAIFFAAGLGICYRYSLINEQFSEIKNLKKEYENVQTINAQIQTDIDSKTDLTYIENYAKYQLGMQKPTNSQLKYISIEKQDKILAPVVIEEEDNASWFEKAYMEFKKIID